jgi:hypothetical protein
VYAALALVPPDELYTSNITTGGLKVTPVSLKRLDTPDVNGAVGHLGEWLHAVNVPLRAAGGTMHRVSAQLVQALRVAADRSTLFLRLDGPEVVATLADQAARLEVLVERPRPLRLIVYPADRPTIASRVDHVVELASPFAELGAQAGDRLQFSLLVTQATGQVLEQQPAWPISLERPSRHLDAVNWVV